MEKKSIECFYRCEEKKGHIQKLAINKKSTIFIQSSWNLWKMIAYEVIIFTKFHEDWKKSLDFFY